MMRVILGNSAQMDNEPAGKEPRCSAKIEGNKDDSLPPRDTMPGNAKDTALHKAVLRRDTKLARKLLNHQPRLIFKPDSQGCLPMHLACGLGDEEMVGVLLEAEGGGETCLEYNKEGETPFHVAAARGQTRVINTLLKYQPNIAQAVTKQGQTALHLCVQHYYFDTLKKLVELVGDDPAFLNAADHDGNTVLHVASSMRQMQALKFLLGLNKVEVNATNMDNSTALDMVMLSKSSNGSDMMKIVNILQQARARRSSELPATVQAPQTLLKSMALLLSRKEMHRTSAHPTSFEQIEIGCRRSILEEVWAMILKQPSANVSPPTTEALQPRFQEVMKDGIPRSYMHKQLNKSSSDTKKKL